MRIILTKWLREGIRDWVNFVCRRGTGTPTQALPAAIAIADAGPGLFSLLALRPGPLPAHTHTAVLVELREHPPFSHFMVPTLTVQSTAALPSRRFTPSRSNVW